LQHEVGLGAQARQEAAERQIGASGRRVLHFAMTPAEVVEVAGLQPPLEPGQPARPKPPPGHWARINAEYLAALRRP
jgi:hypothetical protein